MFRCYSFLNCEGLGLLGSMGMLFPCVHEKLLVQFTTQSVFGQHALNGETEQILGTLLKKFAGGDGSNATYVPAVTVVRLVLKLVAGEFDLISVDDNDPIAGVGMRGVHGIVLTTNTCRDNGSESAKHLILGIDDAPFLWIVRFLCAIGIFLQCCILPVGFLTNNWN